MNATEDASVKCRLIMRNEFSSVWSRGFHRGEFLSIRCKLKAVGRRSRQVVIPTLSEGAFILHRVYLCLSSLGQTMSVGAETQPNEILAFLPEKDDQGTPEQEYWKRKTCTPFFCSPLSNDKLCSLSRSLFLSVPQFPLGSGQTVLKIGLVYSPHL